LLNISFKQGGEIMKFLIIAIVAALLSFSAREIFAERAEIAASALRLTVVFNNEPCKKALQTAWGFACVIEGLKQTILFDTGGNGDILLANMKKLGVDPGIVELVVLSHFHGDHTNGLENFLQQNPAVTVCMPKSFPDSFQQRVKGQGAVIKTVSGPELLFDGVYSTGEMGQAIIEQSLILDTSLGLVVVNGCSHPGIDNIVKKAKQIGGKEIYLVLGGFHLGQASDGKIREIIRTFKELGVKKVGPTHCTGDRAAVLFRQAWGDDFVDCGCGAVIELAQK